MKRLSVFILIGAIALVGWALPAGAEKIRLTDAELDAITAGVPPPLIMLSVPPPSSVAGIANAFLNVFGTPSPPLGLFELGGGTPKGRGNRVIIEGAGSIMSPATGSFRICGMAFGQFFGVGNCP
jgi:hypothetical protein